MSKYSVECVQAEDGVLWGIREFRDGILDKEYCREGSAPSFSLAQDDFTRALYALLGKRRGRHIELRAMRPHGDPLEHRGRVRRQVATLAGWREWLRENLSRPDGRVLLRLRDGFPTHALMRGAWLEIKDRTVQQWPRLWVLVAHGRVRRSGAAFGIFEARAISAAGVP